MAELPSGTITFLFTDIEGSTRLWEQHPDAMRLALARHDALLRAAIETNGGVVFKTVGDAFCAAFPTADRALDAALAIQQNLRQAVPSTHEAHLDMRTRIALHTGAAEVRDGDYFGPALNRAARLRDAGHGGQVLVSQTTFDLVQDDLPSSMAVEDLGHHRLRDLQRPEHVFQLVHPDLPTGFPPLCSLDALPNNLPQQVTSFVGREREIAELKSLLGRTRLLVLTGAGGCGKSRLALQLAADLLDYYPDGTWLVELSPLADPALAPQAVAGALKLKEEPNRPLLRTLVGHLASKCLLLLLDNCEHLLEECALVAAELLRGCPQLRILATSREGLNIPGETVYRLPSLALPAAEHLTDLENLQRCDAVRLFVERGTAALPSFAVTPQSARAVFQICCRLDGIPLALELAAARLKALPVEKIAERLEDRFRLLTGGSRTALPRHRTLKAAIDWSYESLSQPERAVLQRLSVFAGGLTLEAAEAVCAGEPVEEGGVLEQLTRLVEKSLVIYEAATARYRLLETVRQYAQDRLVENEDVAPVRNRHLEFFLHLAEAETPELYGPQQRAHLERLEQDVDNLRAALEWSLQNRAEQGVRLAAALGWFWVMHGAFREGRYWLAASLEQQQDCPAAGRAWALYWAGSLAWRQGDYDQSASLCEESRALFEASDDRRGVAAATSDLGMVAHERGQYTEAQAFFQRSLELCSALGDQRQCANQLSGLGLSATRRGDYATARRCNEESLAIRRGLGDQRGIASSLYGLAHVLYHEANHERALSLLQESLTIAQALGDRWLVSHALQIRGCLAEATGDGLAAQSFYEQALASYREVGDRLGTASALNALGILAIGPDDPGRADQLLRESLSISRTLGFRRGIAVSLVGLAGVMNAGGHAEQAARLLGAGDKLRKSMHLQFAPEECRHVERVTAAIQSRIDSSTFGRAWAEGQAMILEQAVAYALEEDAGGEA